MMSVATSTPSRFWRRLLRRPYVLAVIWIVSCATYWWNCYPLKPERVIDVPWGYAFYCGTPSGDVVLAMQHQLEYGIGFRNRWSGPIHIRDVLSGATKATLFTEDETLITSSAGGRFIAASNGQSIQIVELETNRIVLTRPADAEGSAAAFSEDETLVAVATGQTITMYDTTGRALWSRVEASLPHVPPFPIHKSHLVVELEVLRFAGPLLAIDLTPSAEFPTPLDTPPRNRIWLNARTGEVDARFAGLFDVVMSADQQLAIMTDNSAKQQLVDLAANQTLWALPKARQPLHAEFSEDGTEVIAWHAQGSRMAVARWNARDGGEIEPLRLDPSQGQPAFTISADGRYVAAKRWWSARAPEWVQLAARFMGSRWNGRVGPYRQTIELTDMSLSRSSAICSRTFTPIIGVVTTLFMQIWPSDLHVLPGGQRFAMRDPFGLSIFRFPPPRDWWWLVRWGLGPVVVVAMVRRVWARRRSRRALDVAMAE